MASENSNVTSSRNGIGNGNITATTTLEFPGMGHPNDQEKQQRLFNDPRIQRATLKVGGRGEDEEKEIKGDVLSLTTYSPFFDRELTPNGPSICLADLDADAVELLIRLMYTGKLDVTKENVANLIVAANKLEMEEVKVRCMDFLIRQLSIDNCFQVRDFASQYKFTNLLKKAKTFITNNFAGLPGDFTDYTYAELKVALEKLKRVKDDHAHYQAIKLWGEKDKEARMGHLSDLLQLIDLAKLLESSKEIYDTIKKDFLDGIFKECNKCRAIYLATVVDKLREHKFGQGQTQGQVERAMSEQKAEPSSSGPTKRQSLPSRIKAPICSSPARVARKSASCPRQTAFKSTAPSRPAPADSSSSSDSSSSESDIDMNIAFSSMAEKMRSYGRSKVNSVPVRSIKILARRSTSLTSTPSTSQKDSSPSIKRRRRSTPTSSSSSPHPVRTGNSDSTRLIYALFDQGKKFLHSYDFEREVPTTRTVHQVNPSRKLSTLVYYNDQIFDIGGTMDLTKEDGKTQPTSRVDVFHPGFSSFQAVSAMKEPRRDAQTFICNEYLYAIGGCQLAEGEDSAMNCVERLNVTRRISSNWEEIPDLLYLRGAHAACVLDSKIYVTGGIGVKCGSKGLAVPLRQVECFDPMKNKWTELKPMGQARAYHKMVVTNGKIYAVGGKVNLKKGSTEFKVLNTVEVFDPNNNKWTTCPSMKKFREKFLLMTRRNRIYAIGGDSEKNPTMEVFDLDENEWSLIDWPTGLPRNADFYSAIPI